MWKRDSLTPLRCARNDIWEGSDGFPPTSSRGQDIGGRGVVLEPPLRRRGLDGDDGWSVWGMDSRPVFTGAGSPREKRM